jgi:shikimate dehydrogenase
MKKICVIGWPIAHSRSPLIHNYWLRMYGIDAIYERQAVQPDQLEKFLADLPTSEFIGCNVTIPHKEAAFRLITQLDEAALRSGAVNTLYQRERKIFGTNTDGQGFLENLKKSYPSFITANSKVCIIGAGGSAKAIIAALLEENAQSITIVNRTPERIAILQKQFGTRIHSAGKLDLGDLDLLVNTTSMGMEGQPRLELDISGLNPKAIVADIVYSPLETEFLQRAKIQGNPTLQGLGMLLHQAVKGFELWFGIRPEVTMELHDLIAADVIRNSAK